MNPYEPKSTDLTPVSKPRHQFKWHAVVTTVVTLVVVEWLFIVTGRMWFRYLDGSMLSLPVSMALAMSVLSIAILYGFKSLTEASVGLSAVAIAVLTAFNVFLMDYVLRSV